MKLELTTEVKTLIHRIRNLSILCDYGDITVVEFENKSLKELNDFLQKINSDDMFKNWENEL